MASKGTGVKIAGPLQESRRSLGGVGATSNQPTRQQYRVLDETQRNRRNKQLIDQLERDNFHDEPHANLVMHKKAPKFDDGTVGAGPGATNQSSAATSSSAATTSATANRRSHAHRSRMLTYQQMVEEDSRTAAPNYNSAAAPDPSIPGGVRTEDGKVLFIIPRRHFCSVCGFRAPYTCVTCGYRYCSVACLGTHKDTRCLKWTA